jgi:signal transduction histidine kinase
MFTAVPITDEQSNPAGIVLLVSSAADIFELLDSISNLLVLLCMGTFVVILAVVFVLSEVIISPLKRVLRVVNLMGEGHLNQRIELRGRDEFALLADAFNNMNDKLEQVDKTREEFVSNVSHELKTPLSSMKVLSESILLQDGVPVEMYREFLQDINSEVDRMTSIVNDLLNLVKLDQRDKPLNIKLTEINKMIEDIMRRLYPLAEKKGVELICEEIRKVIISADEMKLSLAISNLVENGIKYTQNGGTVKVTIDADHQNAFITVTDTGIGIAEDEQGKIFTRFYRVDKTRDRDTGGTGLGLSITHSTVLLHNGAIRLTSKEGEGTTFVVRLPIHQSM